MALLKEWQKVAYDETKDRGILQRFWANYFNLEKGVYEKLLEEPDVEVKGTVKELAEKYGCRFIDLSGKEQERMVREIFLLQRDEIRRRNGQ